jgi:cyclic beta-1,2-glucan synthetase
LERYAEFQASEHSASIYDHCCRAIDARIAFGEHGFPFIGTGDWSDGLNRVGEKGHGESVWMAWFLIVVCRRFAPLCRQMDDNSRADHYEKVAADLLQHTQTNAWADKWYLRGYFDDGTPLGAPGDAESAIDLMAQTWAVIADAADPNAKRAMHAVDEQLIDTEHRLIKLLAPPFEKTAHDPGYIRSYPPGVRENGGQYTHAAVWAAWAAVEMGDNEMAMRWFDWLNPLKRARSDAELRHYRLEPYVTAGDIYGVGSLAGRGGWSWYTGSAAWQYRLAIRRLLGLQRCGKKLFIRPCLPDSWPVFEATLRYKEAIYRLWVHDPAHIADDELFLLNKGNAIDAACITLDDDGHHEIDIFDSDAARRLWLSEHPHSSTLVVNE